MHVVIMAGGGGTRLRPLSTAERPKPFLPLLPTGETLLQRTVRRLLGPELPLAPGAISVVASAAYEPLVRAQVPDAAVLVEPLARNTAAAIALAAYGLAATDDEVMVVLPADHRIDPAREGVFRATLAAAAAGLAAGSPFGIPSPLVTLGVAPTRPATEYGYLRPEVARGGSVNGLDAFPLAAFEEKPALARAQELVAQPGVAWNAGMFLWRFGAIRAALESNAPDVAAAVREGLASGDLAERYAGIRGRSIDYAVMEPAAAAGSVVMAALDVGWTDVGTWPVLLEVLGAEGIGGNGGIGGGVLEAGETADCAAGDLVLDRDAAGALVVRAPGAGTMTAERPVALLRGARSAEAVVRALIERCAAAEARS